MAQQIANIVMKRQTWLRAIVMDRDIANFTNEDATALVRTFTAVVTRSCQAAIARSKPQISRLLLRVSHSQGKKNAENERSMMVKK